MQLNNVCMECGKKYTKVPRQCMCGWYFIKQEAIRIDTSRCHYVINGSQCPDPGSTTFWTRGKDWFCGFHARKLREDSFKK